MRENSNAPFSEALPSKLQRSSFIAARRVARSQQRYAAAIEKLHSTQTSYELVSEQFNAGMKNTVELLTEKNNLLQAQQELLQSKYMAILNTQLLKFYQGDKITL